MIMLSLVSSSPPPHPPFKPKLTSIPGIPSRVSCVALARSAADVAIATKDHVLSCEPTERNPPPKKKRI